MSEMKKSVDELVEEYYSRILREPLIYNNRTRYMKEDFKAGYAQGELSGIELMREAVVKVCLDNEKEAFLYESRTKNNVPGDLDLPRNAYNAFRAIKVMIQSLKVGGK